MSIQGRKAGIDTLKKTILNGVNYRYREHHKVSILERAAERRVDPANQAKQAPKKKDMFIVNKTKWYLTATEQELASIPEMVIDGTDSNNKHRIIQHKLR